MAFNGHSLPTITPFSKTVLDDADAATVRRTIGVGLEELSDPVAWYEPDYRTDGTGIAALLNKFGVAANDISQATTTKQPTLAASALSNSQDGVLFDGTDDFLGTVGDTFSLGANGYTVWTYFKANTFTNGATLWGLLTADEATFAVHRMLTGVWGHRIIGSGYTADVVTAGDTDEHLTCCYLDNADHIGALSLDGLPFIHNVATVVTTAPAFANFFVGGRNAASTYAHCTIGTIIVKKGPPTARDLEIVTRYINRKYAKTFPLPHQSARTVASAISAQTDNLLLAGITEADIVELTLTGAQSLTGMEPGRKPRTIVALGNTLTIEHDHASSTGAARRFTCPGAADHVLAAGHSALCVYDPPSGYWRVIG